MENKTDNKPKYTIVNKGYNGIVIDSYTIENSKGQQKSLSVDETIRLARNDKLSNAKAILNSHTGEYILAVDGGVLNLPDKDRTNGLALQLVARVMNNDQCIGYKITNGLGKYSKYTAEKVWDMAERGAIPGLEAKIVGHCKVLIGSELVNLSNLPKIDG